MDTRAKIENFISFCGWGANSRKQASHINFGYPNVEKRAQAILGKEKESKNFY